MPRINRLTIIRLFCLYLLIGCADKSVSDKYIANKYVLNESQLFSHLKALSSDAFAGRKIGSDGNLKAQSYIVHSLIELNIKPLDENYLHSFSFNQGFNSQKGNNIIGLIEGGEHPRQYIVLSAHFDHLGKKGSRVFNGADDNASGTAALLAFANVIINQPLKHSVILLFTDGEESDLKGAKAFVNDYQYLLKNIKLNVNLDMIAGSKKTHTLHFIDYRLNSLLSENNLEILAKMQSSSPVTIRKGFSTFVGVNNRTSKKMWKTASDHGAFYNAHIPFIYFGVGNHKNYHQFTDEYENINPKLFIDSTESIYQQIIFIDKNI